MSTALFFLATVIMSAGSGILSLLQILQGEPPTALDNITLLAV